MFKKLILCCLVIGTSICAKAQTVSNELKQVIPPSPNTASLGKYGDIPVGLYTGIPNINIPLYEIKNGSLSLPVSLSYHSSGTKVEEIPSSVGLGWTLNAGGVIGRSVRGLPDELGNWQPQSVNNTIQNIISTGNPNLINPVINDVYDGYRDGEADLYYYNYNGQSGKFFFDQAGGIHTYPSKNILIERTASGWQITVEDGTVYAFTKVEEISSSGCSEGGDQIVTSAWYLTGIKSSDGKREITFTYEPVWIVSQTLLGQVKYFLVNGSGTASCMRNPAPCLGTNQSRTHRLKQIDFADGYAKFSYNNVRCDLVDDKSLDVMEIYTKSDELVKKYNFGYSYFGNNSDGANRLSENNKRLKLVTLTEQSSTSAKPPYTFTYEEAIELPGRLSYAQDHWGYFNGKFSNPDLIATFTSVTSAGTALYPGADRKANAATAQAAILKKITYPTGGETLFTYESNTVSDNRIEPDYTEETIYLGASNHQVADLPAPYESAELVIPSGGATVRFNVSGLESWPWQGCDVVQCQVIKDNNSTPYTILQNSVNGSSASWPAGTYKLKLVTECGNGTMANFSATVTAQILTQQSSAVRIVGGLRIKQTEDKPGDGRQSLIKTYRYHPDNDPTHSSGVLINFPDYGYDLTTEQYGGDCDDPRVCSISYLGICQCRVRQSFSNYPLATTQGSYVGYSHVIEDLGDNGETRHSFIAYENFIGGPYPFAPIESFDWRRGFEESVAYYAKKNNQLALVKEVINTPLGLNEFSIYGVKTGKNYLRLFNGSQSLQPWLRTAPVYQAYSTVTEFYNTGQTKERVYNQSDPTKFIETVMDYTYSPTHLQLAQTKTVTSRSDQTTQEEIVTSRKYPFDYTFNGTPSGAEALGIKTLQNLHIVNAVIEENSSKQNRTIGTNQLFNRRVIASNIITYKSDNPYPDQIYKMETNSPVSLASYGAGSGIGSNAFVKNTNIAITSSYKPVAVFNSYDNNGNITMQQKANDVVHSYIWGYGNIYPVAEVIGVPYNDVIANCNLAQTVLQATSPPDQDIRSEINKIRIYYPGTQVITYTYKPLVGMTSQTDPNGRTTYYEYDAFGRLLLVRDKDNNVLKKYDYKYNGQ